jgi:hypothetical protein
MLAMNLRGTCENEMNTRAGLIVDTSSFKGIASANSLFNPGRWRTVREQSSLFASRSAITPVCYLIRLSSLNTGLLAAAFLERNCRGNLQDYFRALPTIAMGGCQLPAATFNLTRYNRAA